jgi:menaquinone-dependent protoporphyrinogen oxidase
METKVLVAYASTYGSTQEVAEVITARMRESGLTVDHQPMKKVKSLMGCGAIVLGAPLYLGQWHKDALNFLAQHREALIQRSLAIFALGPTSTDEEEWQSARSMLEKELAKFPWLTPIVVEMFGGKYNPAKLNIPHKLIASLPASPLHGMPASDVRDWAAIRAWADNLSTQLQSTIVTCKEEMR